MLHQTVYMSSTARTPAQAELSGILAQSRRNNGADDITGLLLFHDGHFFQILEGPKERVDACYGRIERDLRHSRCLVLISGPIESRTFASWEMGYMPFSDLTLEQQNGFIDLRTLGNNEKMRQAQGTAELNVLLNTFLATFRNL